MDFLNTNYILSKEDKEFYDREGYLVLKDFLNQSGKELLVEGCKEISNWPEEKGKWMHYFEKDNETGKRKLCRTENFTPYSSTVAQFVSGQRVSSLLEQVFNEPYVIFKEKLNYKLPGGNGFPAHQDFTTFTHLGQSTHVTVLYAVDKMTVANGCLQLVPKSHVLGTLPMEEDTTLAKEWCEKQNWVHIEAEVGDVVVFGSYLAHRSDKNTTNTSRKALYLTYNPAKEGSVHEEYYKSKREHFPPPIERVEGKDYSVGAQMYNLATPIEN
ncbi:PhyH-domain-containing protein [Neoconidiobolus thromboides FSU 785]|nr:PhyH-domain-containing protein [Neoconidiobolus thromboides FSU 785]